MTYRMQTSYGNASNTYNQVSNLIGSLWEDVERGIVYKEDVLNKLRGVFVDKVKPFYRLPPSHAGTYLIQIPIEDTSKALEIFGSIHPTPCIPIVLVPVKKVTDFWVSVPEGVNAIATQFGKILDVKTNINSPKSIDDNGVHTMLSQLKEDDGIMKPGLHLLPPGKKIQWVVIKGDVPFDYPIKACPTLDNVMVKIDCLIVFRIKEALKFILTLGPYKLTDMLAAFLEESIRSLARTKTYYEVYDLRSLGLESMQRSLNDKVSDYGIEIDIITITNVLLPPALQQSMQTTTSYKSQSRCRKKEHEYNTMVQENAQAREILQLRRKNERLAIEVEAKKLHAMISKECDEIEALTRKRLAEIAVETNAQARKMILIGERDAVTLRAEKYKILKEMSAEANKTAALIRVEQESYAKQRIASAERNASENRANTLKLIANAEGKCSKNLKMKRDLDIKMKQLSVLEALSTNKNVVVSGSSDYNPFAQIGIRPFTPFSSGTSGLPGIQ